MALIIIPPANCNATGLTAEQAGCFGRGVCALDPALNTSACACNGTYLPEFYCEKTIYQLYDGRDRAFFLVRS